MNEDPVVPEHGSRLRVLEQENVKHTQRLDHLEGFRERIKWVESFGPACKWIVTFIGIIASSLIIADMVFNIMDHLK